MKHPRKTPSGTFYGCAEMRDDARKFFESQSEGGLFWQVLLVKLRGCDIDVQFRNLRAMRRFARAHRPRSERESTDSIPASSHDETTLRRTQLLQTQNPDADPSSTARSGEGPGEGRMKKSSPILGRARNTTLSTSTTNTAVSKDVLYSLW